MPSVYEANLCHARYYLDVARHCDELFQEKGNLLEATLSLFDQERSQIDRARHGLQHRPPTPETDEMLIGYGDSIVQIALETLRYDVRQEIIPDYMLQVAAARRLHRREIEADILDSLGIFHAFLGNHSSAIPYFESAFKLAQEIGDSDSANDYRTHLAQARKSIDPATPSTNSVINQLPGGVGIWKTESSNTESQGIMYWENALKEAEESAHPVNAAFGAYELGQIYAASGNYQQASTYYQYALEAFQKYKLQWDYLKVGIEQAATLALMGDNKQCMELLTRLVQIYQQHGFAWGKEIDPLFQQISVLYTQLLQTSHLTNSVQISSKSLDTKVVDSKSVDTKVVDKRSF
jgi:tetratricopeptide (TPR) repeat protein